MDNISKTAMIAFLEQMGHFSEIANDKYTTAFNEGEYFPNVVITNNTNYQMFCRSVGLNMVRVLLNLVFHERNHFQNPWNLANIYHGFGTKSITLSSVIDIFNELEEGPRKKYVQDYIQAYKANLTNNQSAGCTCDAFGAFAGLFKQAIAFVENCFVELGQHKYQYYTKLCHVTIKYFDQNHLQLEFIKHNCECGIGQQYQINDLSLLASLACCGNEAHVQHVLHAKNNRFDHANRIGNLNQISMANQYTATTYLDLLNRVGIKPVLFSNSELLKGV